MPIDNKKSRILVVDDEKIITMHLEELLTSMGYSVVGTASNGAEAIQMTQDVNPDLILMDIIMPGDMTGIDAAKEIKTQFGIPVIFLTAFADDKIIEKAKISEPFSYIVKPFQGQELKAAIEIALYKKEMEKKLKDSEEQYRTFVEESRDGIGIIQDGIFRYVNPSLSEMLGKPDDLEQRSFLHYFGDEFKERADYIYNTRIQGKEVQPINRFVLLSKNGSSIPIETNTTLFTYEGKPAILSFFRNISERKHTEHMLDYLVHEINGRNQIVISNIEKIMGETKNKKQNEQMNIILSLLFDNANAMKKAYKLLKVEQGKRDLTLYDPAEKINEAALAVTHQFPEKDIRIHTHIDGIIPNILVDGFIEDVFYMLFEHSVKQTDKEIVDIDVSMKADVPKKPTSIQIRIMDHDGGIPDEEKEKIFDKNNILVGNCHVSPGLSIAKRVIESYSGVIQAEDRIQGDSTSGTTFVINLPISKGNK